MFKKIALAVVIVIVVGTIAVLALAASKPDNFDVARSETMKAPADKIFHYINDLHNWKQWSPWESPDVGLKRSYSGPDSGAGATYDWEGARDDGSGNAAPAEPTPGGGGGKKGGGGGARKRGWEIPIEWVKKFGGTGRMLIAESDPPAKLVVKLIFFQPVEARNTVEVMLNPEGDATKVTLKMTGPNDFGSKVAQVFMPLDLILGKDFARGLSDLKTIVEQQE